VRLVFEGPEGLLSALTSGSLCIEMEVYRMAVTRGMAELDHTAVARLIEEWAGIELWSKPGDPA
jgi:hypothetical protein